MRPGSRPAEDAVPFTASVKASGSASGWARVETRSAGRSEGAACRRRTGLGKHRPRPGPEPRVPAGGDGVDELFGASVPLGVREVRVQAEVARLAVVEARDDVPSGAPAGEVVERCELARDRVRLAVRGDQSDARRGRRERPQQRHWPEAVVGRCHPVQYVGVRIGDREQAGHEQRVEGRGLELTGLFEEEREVWPGTLRGGRMAPPPR